MPSASVKVAEVVVVAVVVAAGSGSRLGAAVPKALVELDGVPLVRRAVDALRAGGVERVVVTVPAGSYACIFAAGGELRQTGITCDDAAASVLDLAVEAGDLRVEGVTP